MGVTTYNDAIKLVTPESLEKWTKAQDEDVYATISTFQVEYLYNLIPEVVIDVANQSSDPLDGLRYTDNVADLARAPWPLVYFFDLLTETVGVPPTWDEYWESMNNEYRSKWIDYVSNPSWSEEQRTKAIQWRLGKAWISWIRELYVLTTLRGRGHDLNRHVFADIEGKVDMWIKDPLKAVCLTVPNKYDSSKRSPVVPYKKFYFPNRNSGNALWFPDEKYLKEIEEWLNGLM